MFEYRATCDRVIDGDTVDLRIDLGFNVYTKDRFRLLGINTPELHSKDVAERTKAEEAKRALELKIGDGQPREHPAPVLTVKTFKSAGDKYGRWLAVIFVGDLDINAQMIKEGYAVSYDGGKKE